MPIELDRRIDIAVRASLSPGDGAKQREMQDAGGTQLLSMRLQCSHDLAADSSLMMSPCYLRR
jgi:hypothetical protein